MHKKLLLLFALYLFCFACKTEKKSDAQPSSSEETVDTNSIKDEVSTTVSEAKAITELTLEDKIQDIRTKFQNIESNLTSLTKKAGKPQEQDYAVVDVEGYYKGDNLVKVYTVEAAGHSAQQVSYYFHNGELFFVYQQDYSEASLHGPFTEEQKRIYIHDNEVVRVLHKTKTSKSTDPIQMDKVPNKDITASVKDKKALLAKYRNSAKKMIATLENDIARFEEVTWISEEDPNSRLKVEGNQFVISYKGSSLKPYYYNYTTTTKDGVTYLTLTNATDTIEYAILKHTTDELHLSYLARGNTLRYKREK